MKTTQKPLANEIRQRIIIDDNLTLQEKECLLFGSKSSRPYDFRQALKARLIYDNRPIKNVDLKLIARYGLSYKQAWQEIAGILQKSGAAN